MNKEFASYTAGKLAEVAGVNIQTIRFYDREGILKPSGRTPSGYRIYRNDALKRLQFIIHAKELGFSLKEIKELLDLRVTTRARERVRQKSKKKLQEVQTKIAGLKKLEKVLKSLINDCERQGTSESCPILGRMEQ